jgi:hypothetical protein
VWNKSMLDEHDDNMNKINPSTWMKLKLNFILMMGGN